MTNLTLMTEFIEGLTPQEGRLIWGMLHKSAPVKTPEEGHELLANIGQVEALVLEEDDLEKIFHQCERSVTRGIGQTIIDYHGCVVKIGGDEEHHQLQDDYGPRGIWKRQWRPVFDGLLKKVVELQKVTPLLS